MEKDTKVLILEDIRKLREKISSLEEELASEKEENSKRKNPCWWDARPCSRYVTAGFQEAWRSGCFNCHRVDAEAFNCVLEETGLSRSKEGRMMELIEKAKETREEGRKLLDNTLEEIHEEILEILDDAGIEPSK